MSGEALDGDALAEAAAIAKACTVMFAVGASLQVDPAACLAGLAVGTASPVGAGVDTAVSGEQR
jgi:NAD-dependent SIR2 family protein deacetylase